MADITVTGNSGYATGSIDTATVLVNGVSPRQAEHVNGPAAAAVQIENVLGASNTLIGAFANLAARLNSFGAFPNLTVDYGLLANSTTTMDVVNHTPVGVVQAFAGTASPPVDWLLCDGAAVSRTTYAKLFAVTGTTYGVGDGSTTFNVPDLRGRTIIMVDGAANRITSASTNGANADTLGGAGGAETHTLVTGESPAHTHTERYALAGSSVAGNRMAIVSQNTVGETFDTIATETASTGGGGAHSNTQPWLALHYIIFTGV